MKKMTEKEMMTVMMKSVKYENQISWDLTMAIWFDYGDKNDNDWWSWYDLVTIIMAIIIIIIMTKIMTIIMTMIKIWQQDNSVKKNDNDHDMTARPCAPYGKPFYLWYIHWLTLKLFSWWWWYHDKWMTMGMIMIIFVNMRLMMMTAMNHFWCFWKWWHT